MVERSQGAAVEVQQLEERRRGQVGEVVQYVHSSVVDHHRDVPKCGQLRKQVLGLLLPSFLPEVRHDYLHLHGRIQLEYLLADGLQFGLGASEQNHIEALLGQLQRELLADSIR